MKVICINDKNRPKEIPPEKWIEEGKVYTVLFATTLSIQLNKVGYMLAEIDLDHTCFPYHYFDSERFSLDTDLETLTVKEEEDLELEVI